MARGLGTRPTGSGPPGRLLACHDDHVIAAVLVMLLSSALYAPALVLQHQGSQESIGALSTGSPKFRDLLKNRTWLAGLILFYVAAVVHIVAISLGSLAVVQPLIVTELIFVPIAARIISKTPVSGRDWAAIVAVAVALAVFLVVGRPTAGADRAALASWLMFLAATIAIVTLLMVVGRRLPITPRAAVLALAAGILAATYAVVIKGVLDSQGWERVFFIVLTVISAISFPIVSAEAFKTGAVTVSTSVMILINPIYASLVSVWLFGVSLTSSAGAAVVLVASVIVMVLGVVSLSRSTSLG